VREMPLTHRHTAWPYGVATRNLDACCVAALRTFSGRRELETKAEWQAWWEIAKDGFTPAGHVQLVE